MSAKKGTVEINFKTLREAVVALNESGLLTDKIKIVGTGKEDIMKNFMKAIDSIEDVNGKFPGPKISLDCYNEIIALEEKAAKDKAKPKAEDKPAKAKADKPAKEKVAKPKKEPRPSQNGQTRPAPGTTCGDIWDYLDKNPDITTEKYKALVEKKGWNKTTANCQRYRFNKFMGKVAK